MDSSDSIDFQKTPDEIFPILQQGVVSAKHKILTIVPNQTIITEGRHDFKEWLMIVFILFCWPAAIIYYLTSKRSSLTIIVSKQGENGCKITINTNGKDADEVRNYMFFHLLKDANYSN